MSDGATQSTTPNVVNVDPDGDVLLVIGTPARVSLRVSSKVLSLASPVFAPLFSPRYSEGIALATKSSDAHPITFPDDDPDAMNLICHAIHFQENTTIKDVPLSLLQTVAEVCEKYDLVKALSEWSESQLQVWRFNIQGGALCAKLMYFFRTSWGVTRPLDQLVHAAVQQLYKTIHSGRDLV